MRTARSVSPTVIRRTGRPLPAKRGGQQLVEVPTLAAIAAAVRPSSGERWMAALASDAPTSGTAMFCDQPTGPACRARKFVILCCRASPPRRPCRSPCPGW